MIKNKTGGNLAFTVSYSMAKDAKNKPAAWTLLSWLTGQAGQKLWVSKGLALPSRSDVKAIGGRAGVPQRGAVRPRLGVPQLLERLHGHEQRPERGDQPAARRSRRCSSDVAAALKG